MSTLVASVPEPAMGFEQVLGRYESYLSACRQGIRRELADAPSAEILAGYFERGKMLRALLVAAVGGDPAVALPAADALELLHGASLVHDDIIDRADERRGLSALHRRVGQDHALVIGDYLILQAFGLLARATRRAPSDRLLEVVHLLSLHAQDCCRGQILELGPPSVKSDEQKYFSIVRGKTASQFAAAVGVGTALAGARARETEALRDYALNIGIAFQIRDDELDLMGDPERLGKPVGNSLQAGRPMLPLIYLAKHGSPAALARYDRIQEEGSDRVRLNALLEEEGIFERVRRVRRRFLSRGLIVLNDLQASPHVESLAAIGVYSANRDF
jgi:octaprenyl-diphosphate synthase